MAARRVFLSYSREDRKLLRELLSQMAASRYDDDPLMAWHDLDKLDGIEAGEEWLARLKTEIAACEIFCIFLTANWAKSNNCRDELSWAEEMNKRVVQIQVRETAIPRPKASRVPNGSVWIATEMGEDSRGRRDEYWRDVVEELQRIDGRARTLARPSPGAGSGETLPTSIKEFDSLCQLVEVLHAYKQLHDIVHELYDRHYKVIQTEVSLDAVDARTRADCRIAIANASADIQQTLKDKGRLLTKDQERIDVLRSGLDEFRTALSTTARIEDRNSSDALRDNLLEFGSMLSRSLSYFNLRMITAARTFDPKRFKESLQGVLDAQEKLKDDLERWVSLIDLADGLLAEHAVLQANHDVLVSCEPDELGNPRKLNEFLSGWPKIAKRMDPLLRLWTSSPADDRLDEDTQENRQLLPPYFSALEQSVSASGEPIDPSSLKTLKRCYGDFWDTFDKYFLGVDRTLKAEYERAELEIGRMS